MNEWAGGVNKKGRANGVYLRKLLGGAKKRRAKSEKRQRVPECRPESPAIEPARESFQRAMRA